jgi:hypothetical protein
MMASVVGRFKRGKKNEKVPAKKPYLQWTAEDWEELAVKKHGPRIREREFRKPGVYVWPHHVCVGGLICRNELTDSSLWPVTYRFTQDTNSGSRSLSPRE